MAPAGPPPIAPIQVLACEERRGVRGSSGGGAQTASTFACRLADTDMEGR